MSVTVEEIKNICFLNLSLEEKIQIKMRGRAQCVLNWQIKNKKICEPLLENVQTRPWFKIMRVYLDYRYVLFLSSKYLSKDLKKKILVNKYIF